MNTTSLVEWAAPEPRRATALSLLPLATAEARRRPLLIAGVFATVALAALFVGMLLPDNYTSRMTIQIDESGSPLAIPRANASSKAKLQPRAAEAKEIALSRKVMLDILDTGGWMKSAPDPITQERLISNIASRITIDSPRQLPNLVQIGYRDSDPQRAFAVTQRLGELIIQESLASKERESRAEYEFINAQAADYHRKVLDAQEKLNGFQLANPDARPGSGDEANRRIAELRRSLDLARLDLANARAQESTTRSQLSGQNPVGMMQSRGSQLEARLASLRGERERLLLGYTEQHPDVIRMDHQIREVEAEMRAEALNPSQRLAVSGDSATAAGGVNPLYRELESRLADARGRSAASASQLAAGNALLGEERARTERIVGSEGTLAELTRNYQVHRDVYEDLLKRRESARVAMNLDIAQLGLSLRVQEPASMPVRPDPGLRLTHVAIAGLTLAVVAPLLLLFGWLRVDPRVRSSTQIEQLAGLPVLGSIPPQVNRRSRRRERVRMGIACALALAVPLSYGLVLAAKWIAKS